MAKRLILIALAVGAGGALIAGLPDIRRFLRIRSM
jgi:hypothetical protein